MNLCYIHVLETLKHEPIALLGTFEDIFFMAPFEDSRRCHSLRAWGRWECQPVNTAASCIFNHNWVVVSSLFGEDSRFDEHIFQRG